MTLMTKPPIRIAQRTLRLLPKGGKVIVNVFAPENVGPRGDDEWHCRFEIHGLGDVRVGAGTGVDALQALIQVVAALRYTLEPLERELTWLSGEPRDIGLPRMLADHPPAFADLLSAAVELETLRALQVHDLLDRRWRRTTSSGRGTSRKKAKAIK